MRLWGRKMALGRNDDCWCGSRRKYKHCHHQIDAAPEHQKYTASQRVYARNWRATAQHHFDGRVYHWLAEQIAGAQPRRILDVGCGSGHGLVALREVLGTDLQITAIDENRSCLQEARETLRRNGVDADVINRMSIARTSGGYDHVAEPLSLPSDAACALIESDVCNDPYLQPALAAFGPFDAVTIWLTGVHMLRQENVNVQARGIDSDGAHRLYVQNATYELADTILRSGGVLQVGDRGLAPESPLLRADVLQAHGHQASVTSLRVRSLTYRLYDEPNTGRTPMRLTPGTSGLVPVGSQIAVLSIISDKP
jgi:SAM-dependent methyltransferase